MIDLLLNILLVSGNYSSIQHATKLGDQFTVTCALY